jgi:hypothetical protein
MYIIVKILLCRLYWHCFYSDEMAGVCKMERDQNECHKCEEYVYFGQLSNFHLKNVSAP